MAIYAKISCRVYRTIRRRSRRGGLLAELLYLRCVLRLPKEALSDGVVKTGASRSRFCAGIREQKDEDFAAVNSLKVGLMGGSSKTAGGFPSEFGDEWNSDAGRPVNRSSAQRKKVTTKHRLP
jgi:hypothetical protein